MEVSSSSIALLARRLISSLFIKISLSCPRGCGTKYLSRRVWMRFVSERAVCIAASARTKEGDTEGAGPVCIPMTGPMGLTEIPRRPTRGEGFSQDPGILFAASVDNEYPPVIKGGANPCSCAPKCDGFFAPANFTRADKTAVVVNAQYRFYIQSVPYERRRRRDPAPALQVGQIVHSEPMAHVPLDSVGVFHGLGESAAGLPFLCDQIDEQALTERGAQGVSRVNGPVGVSAAQFIDGDYARAVCRAQGG